MLLRVQAAIDELQSLLLCFRHAVANPAQERLVMVAYLKSHSPNFDRKASVLMGTSQVDVALTSKTLVASGKCPRCSHEFQYVGNTEVTTVDASSVVGFDEVKTIPPQRLVVVVCQCVEDHASRAADALGCGLSFVVDLVTYAIPNPVKAALALDDQAQFDQLTADPGASIQASAKAWSAGLSALLALVVAGIWVGGQDAASKVDAGSLPLIIASAGGALVLHIIALILLLIVSSGIPQTLTVAKLRRNAGSARNYRERTRKTHRTMIITAAVLGIAGLVPMLFALALWILAPSPDPKLSIELKDQDKPAVCGEITNLSQTSITVKSGGKDKIISVADIDGISAVGECG